jgi:phosphohistidine phosphatase
VKRLWILRHAKSSWSEAHVADRDRPLNQRGERAAVLMGAALAQTGVELDCILASPALRVRQTIERLGAQLTAEVPVCFDPDLYLASADTWLERLRELADADEVLVVGHNPGLEDLVGALAPVGDKAALRSLRGGFVTAALAEISLPLTEWHALRPGTARLESLRRPKDLV